MSNGITRRRLLGATPLLPFIARAADRPNILLISTDQQANSALSAHGNKYVSTPALDSLVASGVSFTESYCTFPLCSPSRSSWFTSRMPHETGVRENGLSIREGMPTMGEMFRAAGYRTLYGGKWHLPKGGGPAQGFDELGKKVGKGETGDPALAAACVDFLSKKPKEPFLLVASFVNPHDVCDWIRDHKGSRPHPDVAGYPPVHLNVPADPTEPEYVQQYRKAEGLGSDAVRIVGGWNLEDLRHYLYSYYRLVEAADRQIGRVLAALRESGLAANTLVVMTTDHGEGMGSHRWGQKSAFWEETVKVPMIVSGPAVRRRGVVDSRTLVSGLDILPTICDFAGVRPPADSRGRSLRPVCDRGELARPYVVSELHEYGAPGRQGRMLRTPRYKYVVFNGGARPEQLFDLQTDPGELFNLAGRGEAKSELIRHRGLLKGWIAETKDEFKPPV